jgi:hypothetical protein
MMKAGVHVSIKNYVCVCVCARKALPMLGAENIRYSCYKKYPRVGAAIILTIHRRKFAMIKIKQCFPNVHREERQNLKLGVQCRYITSQLKSGRKTGLETEQL